MAVTQLAPARPHRTQEERSTATRTKLLDATIGCLNDLGYARTTTIEIAKRARVSRGAQLHHFPTKQELVVTAVEHLFDRRHDEFLHRLAALPADADRMDGAIDLLWSTVSGPDFHAFLELMVAARTDPALRAALMPFMTRFRETVQGTFRDLFGDRLGSGPVVDVAPEFAFALMDGLALARILAPDPDAPNAAIAVLKMIAQMLFTTEEP